MVPFSCPLESRTTPIESVQQHKTLGIFVSEQLSRNLHIEYLNNKLSQVFVRFQRFLPVNIELKMCYAMLTSNLKLLSSGFAKDCKNKT